MHFLTLVKGKVSSTYIYKKWRKKKEKKKEKRKRKKERKNQQLRIQQDQEEETVSNVLRSVSHYGLN